MLLWLLDASNNTAMEPYRAFIADKLPPSQLGKGFLAQSFFTGLGITLANISLFVFQQFIAGATEAGIPYWVVGSFMLGAVCSIGTVLVSVLTTPEIPPSAGGARGAAGQEGRPRPRGEGDRRGDPRDAAPAAQAGAGLPLPVVRHGLLLAVRRPVHRQVVLSRHPQGKEDAVAWTGLVNGWYNIVTFSVAFSLVAFARRRGAKVVHCVCLLLAAVGLMIFAVDRRTSTCSSSRSSASASRGPRSWACPTSWRSG